MKRALCCHCQGRFSQSLGIPLRSNQWSWSSYTHVLHSLPLMASFASSTPERLLGLRHILLTAVSKKNIRASFPKPIWVAGQSPVWGSPHIGVWLFNDSFLFSNCAARIILRKIIPSSGRCRMSWTLVWNAHNSWASEGRLILLSEEGASECLLNSSLSKCHFSCIFHACQPAAKYKIKDF